MTLNILHEDTDIIVCVKPAGTPTQSRSIGTPDMESILKNHIASNASQKQPPYLAIIHRLDQPVEGILIFAKTPTAAKSLNKQLTEYGFGKHYRALLSGTPTLLEGTLTDYLVKDGKTNSAKVCSADTPQAKKAVLHYHITKSAPPYSLADITLETGRFHQIRVQMAHMGCPIVGDRKYGSEDPLYPALQLFAYRLTFKHPCTGKPMDFQLDLLATL